MQTQIDVWDISLHGRTRNNVKVAQSSTYQYAIDWPYASGGVLSGLDNLECRRQWHGLPAGIHEVGGADMLLVVRVDLIQIGILDWILGWWWRLLLLLPPFLV